MEQQAAARLTEMDVMYRDDEVASGEVEVRFVYQPPGSLSLEDFEDQLRETFETHISGLAGVEDVDDLFTVTADEEAGEVEVTAEGLEEPARSTLVTMFSSVGIDVMLGEAPKAVLGFEQYVSQQAQMVRQQTDAGGADSVAEQAQQNEVGNRTRRLRRHEDGEEDAVEAEESG